MYIFSGKLMKGLHDEVTTMPVIWEGVSDNYGFAFLLASVMRDDGSASGICRSSCGINLVRFFPCVTN